MSSRHEPYEDVQPSALQALWKPLHFEFSGRTAKNRLLKAAMSERLCSWSSDPHERGVPSKEMIHLYDIWGRGNLGMILTGNIMIDHTNLEAAGNPIIAIDSGYEDLRFERFQKIARKAKANGSLVVGQVNHAGRQVPASIQSEPISASDVHLRLGDRYARPRAARLDEIDKVVEGFGHAAEYLERAGYDGIQLHAAHGYLLAQFLSLTTNQRTDQYGRKRLQDRLRLVSRIAREIRRRCSSTFILGIKINSVEFQGEGLKPEDARELCETLEDLRFDFVEFSGGTYESGWFDGKGIVRKQSTRRREAYFIEFAQALFPHFSRTKTYITGGLKTSAAMVESMKLVDGVGLAWPMCLEPHLARDILEGRVKGAIRQRIKETAFAFSSIVAGAQMWQLGRRLSPIDLSREESERYFREQLREWAKGDQIGYPKLS